MKTYCSPALFFLLLITPLFSSVCWGQSAPGEDEGIPFLVTFGKDAEISWGDDDFSQVYFFSVPKEVKDPIYIRVFDPDVGGKHDEVRGGFNSRTRFELYGGKGTITNDAARNPDPIPGYDSGTLLASKSFGVSTTYDDKWYTFGPINPSEGELAPEYGGYVFKLIAKGISGDDGNLYRYFMSTKKESNFVIEGGNCFTYECSFRMPNRRSVCHIYPFIDKSVVALKQYNFDWDQDGGIRLVSISRKGEDVRMSEDGKWASSKHEIHPDEKGASIDIQIIKMKDKNNNNVVFKVTNQYDEALRFYSAPIGGIPKFISNIKVISVD